MSAALEHLRSEALEVLDKRLETKREIVAILRKSDVPDLALLDEIKTDLEICYIEVARRRGIVLPQMERVRRASPLKDEVLAIVSEAGPLTTSEIATKMGKTDPREKNSVQCVVSKLIRRGLLSRQGRMISLGGEEATGNGSSDEETGDDDEDDGAVILDEPPGPPSARLGSIGSAQWVSSGQLLSPPAHLHLVPPIEDDAPIAFVSRDVLRSRRKREVRKHTIHPQKMSKRALAIEAALYPKEIDLTRPKTRGDCVGGIRPCPFVSCVHNLYLDVQKKNGSLTLNFPDLEPSEMSESCALDVADRGGTRLEDVGAYMNMTRENVRQIEIKAMSKIGNSGGGRLLEEFIEVRGKPTRKVHLSIVRSDEIVEEEADDLEIERGDVKLAGDE